MPHLSPMSWPLMFLFFWLLLLLITSALWWHQLPHFPVLSSSSTPNPFSNWKWS